MGEYIRVRVGPFPAFRLARHGPIPSINSTTQTPYPPHPKPTPKQVDGQLHCAHVPGAQRGPARGVQLGRHHHVPPARYVAVNVSVYMQFSTRHDFHPRPTETTHTHKQGNPPRGGRQSRGPSTSTCRPSSRCTRSSAPSRTGPRCVGVGCGVWVESTDRFSGVRLLNACTSIFLRLQFTPSILSLYANSTSDRGARGPRAAAADEGAALGAVPRRGLQPRPVRSNVFRCTCLFIWLVLFVLSVGVRVVFLASEGSHFCALHPTRTARASTPRAC